jgi:predicted TIM-barrel fold metal-dependent hydrolase
VLGALVDFDYWLDCPPLSAHEDQIALHQHIAALHGGYLQPVVAYNPWTDIEQGDAGLKRVRDAWATGVFVAVKIYPPTGFMPAGNATSAAATQKRRPDLKKLDDALTAFFTACAQDGIPVIAHAARSNGRDAAHDDFSSPASWDRLLCRVAAEAKTPVISLGHLGGDNPETEWTRQFANLMRVYPKVQIFGDLGYWDHLMCEEATTCAGARTRLKDAIGVAVGAETVGDRVMFATDWLMMSQVPDWQAYPQRVREGLESIAGADQVARILAGNAKKCFGRIAQ